MKQLILLQHGVLEVGLILSDGWTGEPEEIAKGMINISVDDEPDWDVYHMVDHYNNLIGRFEIDSENKSLRIKSGSGIFFWDTEDYYFDMSNWTSKYGKPIELFLALHLSTMMPDLAYDLATNEAFNTKVNIDMKKTQITYDSVELNDVTYTKENIVSSIASINNAIESIKAEPDLEDEEKRGKIANYESQRAKLEKIRDDLLGKSHEVYWPRISSVTKHWFYNDINFEDTYGYTESTTQKIDYSAIAEDNNDPLINENVKINATLSGGVYQQITDPEPEGPNEAILALFQGGNDKYKEFTGEYYRYDGTRATAKEIEEAKNTGKSNTVFKEPVTFIDVGSEDSVQNSYKNAFSAFAILQNAKTQEAEECYRCLKKLLVTLKYFTEDELKDLYKQVLDWFMPDNKKEENIVKDINKYGIIVKDSKEKSIKAPGDGEIIAINNDSITIKFSKLNSDKLKELKDKYGKEYSIQENILVDMQMVISGMTPSVGQGEQIKLGDELGKARDDEVQVYMKYSDGSIVDNVRTYMDITYAQNASGGTIYDWKSGGRFGLRDEFATPYNSGNQNSINLYNNPQRNDESGKTAQGKETWYNPDSPNLSGIYDLVKYVANNTKYDGPCVLALRDDNIWTLDGYVMVAADPDYYERGDYVNTNYGPGLVCDACDIPNDFDIATAWLPPDGNGGYKYNF